MFGIRNRQSQNVQKLIQLDKNLEFGEIIETVTFGDVIVLAVPWTAIEETIHRAGNLSNKILIDPTNPLTADLKGLRWTILLLQKKFLIWPRAQKLSRRLT